MIDHFEKDETNYSEYYCTVLDERKIEKKKPGLAKKILFFTEIMNLLINLFYRWLN